MKLLFVSSYRYPTYHAAFKHGLLMARAYATALKKDFLYLLFQADSDEDLAGVPFREVNRNRLPLRRFHLITAYYCLYLGFFFLIHPEWRGNGVTIITQESKLAALLVAWRYIFGYKVFYECHGLHDALTDRAVCTLSDKVLFVSEHTKQEAEERYPQTRGVLVPNAVDLNAFLQKNNRDRRSCRRVLGLSEYGQLVGYLGRFTALGFDKGIENMLAVLAAERSSAVSMCFVGGTPEEVRHFRERARSLGVYDRALFIEYQSDYQKFVDYYFAMDMLMYIPSPHKFFIEETSPMKLYEYMAAEKPIIVSDFPTMRSVLPADGAVFVDPTDPVAIVKILKDLLDTPGKADAMAHRSYMHVQGKTWDGRAHHILTEVRTSTREKF